MGYDWAERFDDAAAAQLASDPAAILKLAEHPDYANAVPTPVHFIPLLYLAGMAAEEQATVDPVLRSYSMGGISMTSYGIGVDVGLLDRLPDKAKGAARVPGVVPAMETNI
jgi:4,5-DOPA dioxygenase extradiol